MVYYQIRRGSLPCTNPNRPNLTSELERTVIKKRRKPATCATASFSLIFLLLNLWKVSIILLIGTFSAQSTHAVSIAAVSVSKPNENGSLSDTLQKLPSKFNSNDGREGSSIGSISLFGGLVYNNSFQHLPKEAEPDQPLIKKSEIVKRGGPETRITSNQDVTTLALAVDNSSSVAIANINSSWNNVYVSIGTPSGSPFQYPPNPK